LDLTFGRMGYWHKGNCGVPMHGLERLASRAFDCARFFRLREVKKSVGCKDAVLWQEMEDPAAQLKPRLKRRVSLMQRKATNKTVSADHAVAQKMRHEVAKSRWQKVQIQGKHIATTTKLVLPPSHNPTPMSVSVIRTTACYGQTNSQYDNP
jgi:hypothetical protein